MKDRDYVATEDWLLDNEMNIDHAPTRGPFIQ